MTYNKTMQHKTDYQLQSITDNENYNNEKNLRFKIFLEFMRDVNQEFKKDYELGR